jgi:hypothetical protein
MPIYNGDKKIKDLYFNNEKIKEGYYGDKLVYSSAPPILDFELCFETTSNIGLALYGVVGETIYIYSGFNPDTMAYNSITEYLIESESFTISITNSVLTCYRITANTNVITKITGIGGGLDLKRYGK